MEKSEYLEKLTTPSEREVELAEEREALWKDFENSPEYQEYLRKYNELREEERRLKEERFAEAKTLRGPLVTERTKVLRTDEQRKQWNEKRRAKTLERYRGYDDRLLGLILDYASLPNDSKAVFDKETSLLDGKRYSTLGKYLNPQTTEDDAHELQGVLVQAAIDYIREKGLKDIEELRFSVDSLQESAERGEWSPESDSSIYLVGYQKEEELDSYPVRRQIGEVIV